MPKRGKGNNNRVWTNESDGRGPRDSRHDGGKYYYEHDSRSADFTRRVSFKAGTSNRIGKQKRTQVDWDAAIQSRLGNPDDDVDMPQPGYPQSIIGGRRFNPYNRGGRGRGRFQGQVNSPAPNQQLRKLIEVPTNWYKIVIPHGAKHDRQFILTSLERHIAPVPLIPFYYRVVGAEASFYVDNFQTADAIFDADRKIATSNGFKLLTRVRAGFPPVQVDDGLKERMKQAMAKRYNAENRALNLERFHMDPTLVDDLCVALFRPNLMLAAVDIIAANIPELAALSLGDNKLHSIDHLSILATKLPNLAVLHMGQNKIRDVRQLEILKDLKLVDLVLEGNPLCDKFKERSIYVSEVIKRFPKLRKLDGVDLPPPIMFDQPDEDETHIPPYNGSFLINQEGRDFLRQFLEQYFRIYDDDARQPLADAYHDEAMFSLSCAYMPGSDNSANRLDAYMPLSRNLHRVKDPARRSKLLSQGKAAILGFLSDLPRSQHDPMSFAVDMPIYTPQLIQINVSGIFRERDVRSQPMRSFSRVFVIVPVGAGFCVVNETMFVTNATELQEKSAFRSSVPTAAQPAPGPSAATHPAAQTSDPGVRSQMVQALHQQTRMNASWAAKCLEETNWNYDLAVVSFAELNKVNAIPPEAFIG